MNTALWTAQVLWGATITARRPQPKSGSSSPSIGTSWDPAQRREAPMRDFSSGERIRRAIDGTARRQKAL
jgi:hypothetical protein